MDYLWTIYTISFCIALVVLVFFLILIGESKNKAFEAQKKALDAEYLCLSHELDTISELDDEKVESLVVKYPDFEQEIRYCQWEHIMEENHA